MNKQVIISIGREYGSGGHVIAEIIAKHYNIPLYDRNILDELSKETGNSYDVYKKYDEKPANPFITRTVLGQSNSVEKIIAEMQFNFLKEKAESGESYVVLGRCAEDILQDNDGLISIFLVGDTDVKQKRIMEVKHVSADEALTKMKRHDKSRKQYHNSFSSGKWGDSRYYDICITGHDHLCCLVHTVQTGTTYHVHGNCGNFNGKSCLDRCLTCYVLSLASLDYTSHIYLVNCFGSNACSLQSLLDNDCAQLRCRSCA